MRHHVLSHHPGEPQPQPCVLLPRRRIPGPSTARLGRRSSVDVVRWTISKQRQASTLGRSGTFRFLGCGDGRQYFWLFIDTPKDEIVQVRGHLVDYGWWFFAPTLAMFRQGSVLMSEGRHHKSRMVSKKQVLLGRAKTQEARTGNELS